MSYGGPRPCVASDPHRETHMRLQRTAIAGLLATAVLTAPGATAAPEPHVKDPAGDHPVAMGDIVTATFSTVRGKVPALRIQLSLAAAPTAPSLYSYTVSFTAGECPVDVMYHGSGESGTARCVVDGLTIDGPSVPVDVSVSGSTITFRIPLGGDLRTGVVLTDLAIVTAASGAVAGRGTGDPPLGDTATSTRTYRIGS